METKERITSYCLELFFKYGIKSISIDDLSNSMGMSKKTFYQYFENKEEVIKSIVVHIIEESKTFFKGIMEANSDSLSKLYEIYFHPIIQFSACNPRFFYDVKKYYPELFDRFIKFSDNDIRMLVTSTIKTGKEEGVFRKEIDEETVYKFHQSQLASIIEGTLLPGKTINDPVFQDFIYISLIGISTLEGHAKLEIKINNIRKDTKRQP